MYRKLLVGVDASDAAMSALKSAAEFARQVDGQILLVHVVNPAAVVAPEMVQNFQPVLVEMRKSGEALLKELRQKIPPGVDVEALLLEGDPADTLVNTAASRGADLIVIGTDSRGRLADFLLGSTADSVIRRAGCPVITVRSNANPVVPTNGRPRIDAVAAV